jgi:transposase InsO family protein
VRLLRNAECLNETTFYSLTEARAALAEWREDYDRVRLHSALADRTREEFRNHRLALAGRPAMGKF